MHNRERNNAGLSCLIALMGLLVVPTVRAEAVEAAFVRLSNGEELFREEDAAALAEMGHFVTAADANPAMASRLIRDALASGKGFSDSWDRACAVAALVDLRGDEEADYVVKWFYDAPVNDSKSSDQSAFFSELRRRDPKRWRETLHKIVAHPGFEKLAGLDVNYAAMLVNQLSGGKVVPDQMLISGRDHENRTNRNLVVGMNAPSIGPGAFSPTADPGERSTV